MQYTKYGYRINPISEGLNDTWIFLPGGPGLGSEYLIPFCQNLNLPGTVLLVDFPKDGTNEQGQLNKKYWEEGLIDLLKIYPNSILVTHSFAGMFILGLPQLEDLLRGLVIMNTTTRNTFFQHVSAMRDQYHLPDLLPAAGAYHLNPTNETYRDFWEVYRYYCFTAEEIPEGEKMIPLFAFNSAAYYYAIQHFYPDYHSKWHPMRIPAMTITSENDYVCPADIFMQDPEFNRKNITNKIIPKAGHCPWVLHFSEVKKCFEEFVEILKK